MPITTYDGLVSRISNQFNSRLVGAGNYTVAKTALYSTPAGGLVAADMCLVTPTKTLPSGVTSYIPTEVIVITQTQGLPILIAEMIDLGSLDISGASGTFTDGSTMGTRTEGGATNNNYASVMMEVTTALNATPGSITVTYIDQDGNTAEPTTSITLAASAVVGSGAWLPLNNPDIGVRDITAATRTGGTSPTGVIKFWGVRPIALVPSSGGAIAPFSLLNNGIIRRLPANANIMAIAPTTAATGSAIEIKIVGDN